MSNTPHSGRDERISEYRRIVADDAEFARAVEDMGILPALMADAEAHRTPEDVAMDDINDGGPDNPAQFDASTD